LTGANFDLLDLDRVEIARGPQGVLGGRNSEGGSIKLYSQKPKGDSSGSLRATFGSRNLQDIRATGDFSIVPDELFVRLSSVAKKQDGHMKRYDYGCLYPDSGLPDLGQQHDCLSGTQGGKNYTASRAAIRWLASDTLEINLSADLSMDKSEVAAVSLRSSTRTDAQAYVPTDPYITYATFTNEPPDGRGTVSFAPVTRTEVWGSNFSVDWTISDSLTIKSITAYREFDSNWVTDNDTSPISLVSGAEHIFNDTLSQELRLNGIAFQEAVDFTVGTYYFDQTTTYETHQILNYVGPGLEFRGDDQVDASSYAGFFNASWHVTDAMNVNMGLRYTKEEKTYAYSRQPVGGSPTLGLTSLEGSVGDYEGDGVDYRLNVDYRFTDQFLAYASVSTAFKGGGTNARPFGPGQIVPFDKEVLTAYEIGAKTDFMDKRLRINAAAFFNDYEDIQLTLRFCPTLTPPAPCAARFNAGDAEIKGAEVEIVAAPIEGLLFELTASMLDFEYTTVNPDTGLTVGQTAPHLVEDKYSLGGQYSIDLANGATVTPRLDYVYQGEFHTSSVFTDNNLVEDYGLLNGRLTWQSPDQDWEVSLIGKNLTDEVYYLSNFDQTVTAAGFNYGIIGAPREFAVQIKKNF
jgi:iron complex outermembrane receptor protein